MRPKTNIDNPAKAKAVIELPKTQGIQSAQGDLTVTTAEVN